MNIYVYAFWKQPGSWTLFLDFPNPWIPNPKMFFTTDLLPVNYCPHVWHFCGITNNNKLENIQWRPLDILFLDYEFDVHDLLDSIGGQIRDIKIYAAGSI